MKKLPIGIQTFSEIIKEYLYVDNTQQITELLEAGKYLFYLQNQTRNMSCRCSI